MLDFYFRFYVLKPAQFIYCSVKYKPVYGGITNAAICPSVCPMSTAQNRCILRIRLLWNTNRKHLLEVEPTDGQLQKHSLGDCTVSLVPFGVVDGVIWDIGQLLCVKCGLAVSQHLHGCMSPSNYVIRGDISFRRAIHCFLWRHKLGGRFHDDLQLLMCWGFHDYLTPPPEHHWRMKARDINLRGNVCKVRPSSK